MVKQRFIKQLRNQMTDAEYRLWYFLRNRWFSQLKFRRQVAIGKYIVDFVSFKQKLIIECDGGQHALQKSYDQTRTSFLEKQGFTVLRFWNHDILSHTEVVLNTIEATLKVTPHPRFARPVSRDIVSLASNTSR